ncbi:MAG: N-acetylmuramoyl-L-alanine amidase [Elusimicrobiota bacterium]
MRNIRQLLMIVLLLLTVLSVDIVISAEQCVSIDIIVDGKNSCKKDLVLIKNMGYLKARDISDIFGASLEYRKSENQIIYTWNTIDPDNRDAGKVVFTIGSEYVVMDGIKRKMRKSPQIIDGQSYIPLEAVITRAFESAVGVQIKWDFQKKSLWLAYKGNIAGIRKYCYDNYTRFVVELTEDLDYSLKREESSIDLFIKKGKLSFPETAAVSGMGAIKKIEVYEGAQGLRLILHTEENAAGHKVKKLPGPPRIVLDIEHLETEVREPPEPVDKLPPVPAGPAKRDKANIRDINLVVIDPGHGGKDPGAIGPRGTREKDITLSIANKLAKMIRQKLKIRVVLTRTHDTFVPLAKRTEIANAQDADIFISIHTNAALNPKSGGFEVYFLASETSDIEAQAVANMENSVLAMEENSEEMSRVSKILWSLTMNQFMNESSELSSFINRNVVKQTELEGRGVKQAGFYVMRGARMPAVLIETAFISNKNEERMLCRDNFQDKIAYAVCDAVADYKEWVRRK